MERKYAFLIVLGLLVGAIYGVFYGKAIENDVLGVALGAFGGIFLGWFVAIIAQNKYGNIEDKE
jgi:hypothetical protein